MGDPWLWMQGMTSWIRLSRAKVMELRLYSLLLPLCRLWTFLLLCIMGNSSTSKMASLRVSNIWTSITFLGISRKRTLIYQGLAKCCFIVGNLVKALQVQASMSIRVLVVNLLTLLLRKKAWMGFTGIRRAMFQDGIWREPCSQLGTSHTPK